MKQERPAPPGCYASKRKSSRGARWHVNKNRLLPICRDPKHRRETPEVDPKFKIVGTLLQSETIHEIDLSLEVIATGTHAQTARERKPKRCKVSIAGIKSAWEWQRCQRNCISETILITVTLTGRSAEVKAQII